MTKQKVNYYVFDMDDEVVVIMEDGGVASTYDSGSDMNDDSGIRTEYYQERITSDMTIDNVWELLGEGKMYSKDWKDDQEENPTKEELIEDMIGWLYVATEDCEFVRNDMSEWNEENFNKIKKLLK